MVYGKWVNFLSITKGETVFVRAGLKPVHFVSGEKVELEPEEGITRITGIISGDSARKDFYRKYQSRSVVLMCKNIIKFYKSFK